MREIELGVWRPAGKRESAEGVGLVSLEDFATGWLVQHECSEGTRSLYERTFRLHIFPFLGKVLLADLTEGVVEAWWREIAGRGERAKELAYARLFQVVREAERRGLIEANPCRIRGARGAVRDRDVVPATPVQARAAAMAMPAEWRIAILLAASTFLRSGEVRELRRGDLDLDGAALGFPSVRIQRGVFRIGSTYHVGPTKNRKVRRVQVPPDLVSALQEHLDLYAAEGSDGLLIHRRGKHVAEQSFQAAWHKAADAAGLPKGFRFHDLRHTGLTWLAGAGATIRELMEAAGHSTADMAIRYQHVAQGRQAALAAAMPAVAP